MSPILALCLTLCMASPLMTLSHQQRGPQPPSPQQPPTQPPAPAGAYQTSAQAPADASFKISDDETPQLLPPVSE